MDAMSDAIEGADVMLYGVSLAYKESANVRSWQAGRLICPSLLLMLYVRVRLSKFVSVCVLSVSIGGQLRAPARAGHDPTDDAARLQASRMA